MFENVRKASAAGLSSTIHAIGDKANHDVLDVFAMVRERGRQHRACAIASSTCSCCIPTISIDWRS